MKLAPYLVKAERWKKGWSQRDLAMVAGVSPMTITKCEQGKDISPKSALKIRLALDYKDDAIIVM